MEIDNLPPIKLTVETVTISNGRNLYKFDEAPADSTQEDGSTVTLGKDENKQI